MTPAQKAVLVGLAAIAVFELGLTGRFTKLWHLAFGGSVQAATPSGGSGGGGPAPVKN